MDEKQTEKADVNADGKVNATDALNILQHTVGLLSRFQAERIKTEEIPWSEGKAAYANRAPAQKIEGIRTTGQDWMMYNPSNDLTLDATMVYCNTISELKAKVTNWQENGTKARVDVMFPAGRDNGEFLQYFPERGDADTNMDAEGNILCHGGGPVWYIDSHLDLCRIQMAGGQSGL